LNSTDPTYLRIIVDGLSSGALQKHNPSALPQGLVGVYEEAIPQASQVNERKKFLEFFGVWALMKKEVSAEFVVSLLDGWSEEEVLAYIGRYSKWFNSPASGLYALYHERFRAFVLLKCSQCFLQKVNSSIVNLLSYAQFLEAVSYKYECAVYHYLFQNKGSELIFLTDTNNFINARKIKTDITCYHGLFEIVFSKLATLGLTNEVGLLMRSFKQYLDMRLESGFFDCSRLIDDDYVRSFINELKIIPVNQRKVFWFNIILDLVTNREIKIVQLNHFLAIYDSEEDDIISTYKNENENVYSFNNYDIRFERYPGLSRGQVFSLINELIQKGVDLKWLLNRFFWLASFAEARDGFISNGLAYQQDFSQIDFCNRELVLQKLRETEIFNIDVDLYRGSHFNQQFIILLSETRGNIPINILYHKPILFSSNEEVVYSRLAEFSFNSTFFSLSLSERASLTSQDKQLYYLLDKEAVKKLDYLIFYIKTNDTFEGDFLKDLLTDFFCNYCGGTFEDVLWLHDEFLDCINEMIRYICLSLSAIEIKKLLEFISEFLEVGIWNDYIGMDRPMSKLDAYSFWKNPVLPLFCSDLEFTNRLVELTEIELFSKAEIIQCVCEINSEINSDFLSILNIDLVYITKEFKNDSLSLFKILKKLNISEDRIFLNAVKNNVLDFKLTILLLSHGYSNDLLIKKIVALINSGPFGLELLMLKHYLLPIYDILSQCRHFSRSVEYSVLGIIRNAPIKIDIQPYYQKSNCKIFFLYVFRNDPRYMNDLTSNLHLN